jgi:signal peptidase I
LILIIVIIKFIFFPLLSLATGTSLPLVVVESCSMYHESGFDSWWGQNAAYYESKNINESEFSSFSLKNGLNKGDIIIVNGAKNPEIGDIIIFNANSDSKALHPIIHRVISENPLGTKGDHNFDQLAPGNNVQNIDERNIKQEQVVGKAVFKIPYLGWLKLIFFSRGSC